MLTFPTQELIGWPLGQRSTSSYSGSGLEMEIHYEPNRSSKGRKRNQMYLLLILSGSYVSLCGCNHSLTYGFCSCDDVLKDHLPFCAEVLLSERSFLLFIKIHILLKTQTTHVRERRKKNIFMRKYLKIFSIVTCFMRISVASGKTPDPKYNSLTSHKLISLSTYFCSKENRTGDAGCKHSTCIFPFQCSYKSNHA